MLDEPLSYVDKQFASSLVDIIDGFASSATVILVSHEMNEIVSRATRHIIVDREVYECAMPHIHRGGYFCFLAQESLRATVRLKTARLPGTWSLRSKSKNNLLSFHPLYG